MSQLEEHWKLLENAWAQYIKTKNVHCKKINNAVNSEYNLDNESEYNLNNESNNESDNENDSEVDSEDEYKISNKQTREIDFDLTWKETRIASLISALELEIKELSNYIKNGENGEDKKNNYKMNKIMEKIMPAITYMWFSNS